MDLNFAFPFPFGGNHDEFSTGSPTDFRTYLQQISVDESTMEDLLRDESGADHAPPDPHSSGDTTNYSTAADAMEVNAAAGQGHGHAVPQLVGLAAGPTAATGAEILHQPRAHTEGVSPGINPVGLPGPYPVGEGERSSAFNTTTGFNFNMQQINAAVTPTAAALKDMPSAEGARRREPIRLQLVDGNASFTQPDLQYSAGESTGPPSTTTAAAADMGICSPDLEVNNRAGLPQSGGGALTEAPERGSGKRKKLVSSSSSQRSTSPEFDLVELLDVLLQSDPSATDIKPPTGSTEAEIIRFLKTETRSMPHGKGVNLSLGEQDQMAPKDARSYVTTVDMVPDQKTHLGYWKEVNRLGLCRDQLFKFFRGGLKRTFQFHKYDGTKTKWFMEEYVPMSIWGLDQYMEELRFREIYEGAEVPGEPTSRRLFAAVAVKHRLRGPDDRVVKGESPVWEHFIKIYDRHPELVGSKVVYAACCYCPGVLRAATENGTSSLSTHCKRTCPNKHL